MQLACWLTVFLVLVLQPGVESRVRGRQYDEEKDTIVELPQLGSIQGKILETAWTKREVLQFVDVRYAEPPTGLNRFKVYKFLRPELTLKDII